MTVEELLARTAVIDVIHRFCLALDEKDWTAYGQLFTDDGTLQLMGQTRVGPAAIAAGPARDLGGYGALQHFAMNHVVDVDGDDARGQWYCHAVHVPDQYEPQHHADVGLCYRFRARRDDGVWRFAELSAEMRWGSGLENFLMPEGAEEE